MKKPIKFASILFLTLTVIHTNSIFSQVDPMELIRNRSNAAKEFQVARDSVGLGFIERARERIKLARELDPNSKPIQEYYEKLMAPDFVISGKEVFFYKETPRFEIQAMLPENEASRRNWVKMYSLIIINSRGDIVFREKTSASLPEKIYWDGKSKGKRLPDGNYIAQIEVKGDLGFVEKLSPLGFLQWGKKLEAIISVKEESFQVGTGDIMIHAVYPQRSRVTNWQLLITNNAGKKVLQRNEQGPLPETIKWNHKNDSGDLVESADIYTLTISGKDKSGKKWKSNSDTIESEIEMFDEDGKKKFRMTTLNFDTGKSTLKKNSHILLRRVALVFEKYNWFDIEVQGHTDDVGGDEANMKLSLARAQAVMKYLVDCHKLPAARFATTGLGETRPVADNRNEKGKAKNRRVEFVMTENLSRKN